MSCEIPSWCPLHKSLDSKVMIRVSRSPLDYTESRASTRGYCLLNACLRPTVQYVMFGTVKEYILSALGDL